jgi:hypothetical protein
MFQRIIVTSSSWSTNLTGVFTLIMKAPIHQNTSNYLPMQQCKILEDLDFWLHGCNRLKPCQAIWSLGQDLNLEPSKYKARVLNHFDCVIWFIQIMESKITPALKQHAMTAFMECQGKARYILHPGIRGGWMVRARPLFLNMPKKPSKYPLYRETSHV